MWYPEPDLVFGEIQLGDVGYIHEGMFIFLFNCLGHDNPRNARRGVPDGFEPFIAPPFSITRRNNVLSPGEEIVGGGFQKVSLVGALSGTVCGHFYHR